MVAGSKPGIRNVGTKLQFIASDTVLIYKKWAHRVTAQRYDNYQSKLQIKEAELVLRGEHTSDVKRLSDSDR